ncbi:hypothetical protein LPJ61_001485 [Coemansia biformis]|uniref:Fork-head domain-containing protein n=1 Tax=Coemansia biformis TaxID=1286918 RepID=A0A9W8CX91_9FUNG|nr:hypothetical protein LPJ61_001485 [Coemansia biformis]
MGKPTDPLSTPQLAQHTFDASASRDRLLPPQPQPQPPHDDDGAASTTAPMSAAAAAADAHAPVQAYAKLEGPDFCYYVRTLEVSLGRHSSGDHTDSVDIDLGDSKAVSRRHAKIFYSFVTQCFELQVFGKNGCLIDDEYHAKGQCVPLRHKMVIQIGDTEFSFLLPKAAMPAPGAAHPLPAGYPDDPATPRRGKAPAARAHHHAHPPYPPHHHHQLPLAAPPPPLPHHPPQPAAPPHGGYPVSAITPQRLNLYPSADASGRAPRAQPTYAQSHPPPHSSQYSPGSLQRAGPHDREPPAPLSFGNMRRSSPPHLPAPADAPYGGDVSDSVRRTDSHTSQDSLPQHQQQQSHQRGAVLVVGGRSAQPRPAVRQGPPQAPPQAPPHGSGAAGAATEVRILPSTERPASSDLQHVNAFSKPSFSYASLIAQAVNSTPEAKITLNGIYTYIMANYPYYKHAQNGWQNSIRHNLSLNKAFIRVQRASNEPGKGSYWAIDDAYKCQFANGVYKRTRRTKRAMELDRERERERVQQRVLAAASTSTVRPKRVQPAAGPHVLEARSMAGEKRSSPDDDDDDDDDEDNNDGDGDEYGAPNSIGAVSDPHGAARPRPARHMSKRASIGAQSTGDDTIGYMSSTQSNNDDSRPGSLPGSPQDRTASRGSSEAREEPEPPAASTRSKTGSARQGPGAYASPAAATLPSSSRPSQPRPQRGVAR